MKAKTVEVWAWVLIYGGLLLLSLGLFTRRSDDELGHSLVAAGGLLAALGAALVLLRACMKSD
jgi:hypothetical protein